MQAPSIINPLSYFFKESAGGESRIPFEMLTPIDTELCFQIAKRGIVIFIAANTVIPSDDKKWPEDALLYAMDIAAVHVADGPLQLLSFLMCDPIDFASDFINIVRFVNRESGVLPPWVSLRNRPR